MSQVCPKFLARIAKHKDDEEDEIETTKKHTLKGNNKKGYLNRKVVHRVLLALEKVNLSDVDTDSEEDTSKGRKNLIGLCLIASSKRSNDNDASDDSYNEVEPSYDDLAKVVEKLGTLLEKRNKKIKKHDVLIKYLYPEIDRLILVNHVIYSIY